MLEQPANETPVQNVLAIRERRHENVDKQSKLLVYVEFTHLEVRPRPRDIPMFASRSASSLEFCFISGSYTENVEITICFLFTVYNWIVLSPTYQQLEKSTCIYTSFYSV